MTIWDYNLQYAGEILEGTRPCPAGITLAEGTELARAAELFRQVDAMGAAAFVRACAAQDGTEIPQAVYDAYDPEAMRRLLAELPGESGAASAPRSAYAVLLDCCCLEERLVAYLIQVLKDGDALGFFRLARVTAQTDIRPEAFLAWMATLEDRAGAEERACAAAMDALLARLLAEGQGEAAAALLSGDPGTFEAVRREAPELRDAPDDAYAWYARNYLDRYYPIRILMQANGVAFPRA